jgi:hypothetical protein
VLRLEAGVQPSALCVLFGLWALVGGTSCDLKLEFSQVPGVFIVAVGSCRKSAQQLVAKGCASLTGCWFLQEECTATCSRGLCISDWLFGSLQWSTPIV